MVGVSGKAWRSAAMIVVLLLVVERPAQGQDAAAGERVFAQCRACHQVGETAKNGVGPQLNGLWGRKAGTVPGYSYSQANKDSGITWTPETFRPYIKDPRGVVPGTKMSYAGLKDDARIDDLIAFLGQYNAEGKKTQQN